MYWTGWAGKAYFEWPRRSEVYEVDIDAARENRYVKLPDGIILKLEDSGTHEVTLVSNPPSSMNPYNAQKVFNPLDADPVFDGDWLSLLWRLNAAAATNNLFHIILTEEEYERLVGGSWSRLLQLMCPRARELVRLHREFYMDEDQRPAIELLRMGRCP